MLEMSPQPRPGLPPTDRWKVKRRWGASDPPVLLFTGSCFSFFKNGFAKRYFILDRYGFWRVHYFVSMSECQRICAVFTSLETQAVLATGLQLNDQLFQTAPLHCLSSLQTVKDIEVNGTRKWKWSLCLAYEHTCDWNYSESCNFQEHLIVKFTTPSNRVGRLVWSGGFDCWKGLHYPVNLYSAIITEERHLFNL